MDRIMLESALSYHGEGLNVIPVVYKDKKPALATWEEYHTRVSTENEVRQWFGNGHQYNIGLVHCRLESGCYYSALDIDHDFGLVDDLFDSHPHLFKGRIEQSGSGEGYHVPLLLDTLPDFGFDQRQNRPRGNRTWKTQKGIINLRVFACQTVAPPSIHPSGNEYRFLQGGPITQAANLDSLIEWLNQLAPPPVPKQDSPRSVRPAQGNDLLAEVKAVWDSALKVFDHFTMAAQPRKEPNGEIRLCGNGGLLLTEDLQQWFCFSDDFGGGVVEAWGYCRFGSAYDKHKHFRQVLLEMAEAGGIQIKPIQYKESSIPCEPLPFEIPASGKVIIVSGKDKAKVLEDAGLEVIGLPGNVFKRAWVRLFNRGSIVYIVLDPGKERQAEMIAGEFKANGIQARACYLPVKADELLSKYGGTVNDFYQFLSLGKRI